MSEHTHTLPDGTEITHTHAHPHTQTKAVLNRLSRAIGHLESVKRMVEDAGTAPRCSYSWPPCARP